jgi:hypothetical protein
VILAHKFSLHPCLAQRVCLAPASDVAHKAYTWALGEWESQRERDVNAINLRKMAENSSVSACGTVGLLGPAIKQELVAGVFVHA